MNKYTWAVFIWRDTGVIDTVMFYDEAAARAYYETDGANWSEAYLLKVVEGPKV